MSIARARLITTMSASNTMSTYTKLEKKITIPLLSCMKKKGKKITMLTAYDATFARLIDGAGIEMILIGDSLGQVIQGHENTLPVTLDDIIYHTRAVKRGAHYAHIVADMPFLSYQISPEEAVLNAGLAIKEGGAESVKIEGGLEMVDTVKRLTSLGIPVMVHIGLKPQRVNQMGGYKIQGKTLPQMERLLEEAKAFEEAGAYSILLEGIAAETAREITKSVKIPTIGIGSGPDCDGQVLVIYDLLGMDERFAPKFLKKYTNLSETISGAVSCYRDEVKSGKFPAEENSFHRHLKSVVGSS